MVHCALGGENRRVPRPGRLMKGKLLENSGITSSDLLQVFHLNRYWECWGHQRKRMKDRHTSYENCIKSIQFGPLASTQRSKLEANICGRGSDWWALSAMPPEDVSSIRWRNIWWWLETQLMASTLNSDIYSYIHVIVLQT